MAIARKKKSVSPEAADKLADRLVDKPYDKPADNNDTFKKTSISIPEILYNDLEDIALANKRRGKSDKSVSAIYRAAIDLYLKKYHKDIHEKHIGKR